MLASSVQLIGIFLLGVLSVSGQTVTEIACNPATQPAVLTDGSGYISTPNFPQNYPDNTVCKWLIVSNVAGGWVSLDFTNFYTEATYDIVMAYDGDNENAPILGGFEGIYDPPAYGILTTQQNLLITFTSDPFTNRLGFGANYASVAPYDTKDPCATPTRPQLIEDYTGTITTKNYPGNYWNYQTCAWLIESQEPGGTVSLKINRFYTDLNNDYVYVYDGPSTSSALLARISGPRDVGTLPITYQSTQTYLSVIFTSNPLLSRYGFTADFTSVPAGK